MTLSRPARGAVLGFGLFLSLPVLATSAHAEERAPAPGSESVRAREELEGTLARMTSVSHLLRRLLRDARARGTKQQNACLDEALSRTDVARRSARAEAAEAFASYARGQLEAARSARARVAELEAVQRIAARDGTSCVPLVAETKCGPETTVRVIVNPRIPNVEPEAP